jgi:hypothetical protein
MTLSLMILPGNVDNMSDLYSGGTRFQSRRSPPLSSSFLVLFSFISGPLVGLLFQVGSRSLSTLLPVNFFLPATLHQVTASFFQWRTYKWEMLGFQRSGANRTCYLEECVRRSAQLNPLFCLCSILNFFSVLSVCCVKIRRLESMQKLYHSS